MAGGLPHIRRHAESPMHVTSMKMGRTKCSSIISNVLCPVETKRVAEKLQNTRFSVFVDEISDITNDKWMTFLVRYIDESTLDIPLSCDNAPVMIGKNSTFKTKLQSKCKNLLTFPCPCHSAALVARAASAEIPDFCEKFLKQISNYINSSPKRLAFFNDFSDWAECENYSKRPEEIGHENVTFIREKCLKFYVTAAIEIRNQFTFKSDFLKKLNVFQPRTALFNHDRETSFDYEPSEAWQFHFPNTIQPVPKNKEHMQILHSKKGHWGDYFLIIHLINVQYNFLLYNSTLMRLHLMKIFKTNVVEHFPQDMKFDILQNVHSLLPITTCEAELIPLCKSQGNNFLVNNNYDYKFVKESYEYSVNMQNIPDSEKNLSNGIIKVYNNQTITMNSEKNNTKHKLPLFKKCVQHEQHNYKLMLAKPNNKTTPSLRRFDTDYLSRGFYKNSIVF
ncbi:hypothetical protein PV327_001619 [Microctonus hyperodae]|uniref:DUF4371 domain-containing protein n=1 Tax=Microctonus hyperodae TaxID=165561 RepID=A0AA39KN91_MICHY|nr:hypothetical protein PV327_001619 [Microctonus hyperodae]